MLMELPFGYLIVVLLLGYSVRAANFTIGTHKLGSKKSTGNSSLLEN